MKVWHTSMIQYSGQKFEIIFMLKTNPTNSRNYKTILESSIEKSRNPINYYTLKKLRKGIIRWSIFMLVYTIGGTIYEYKVCFIWEEVYCQGTWKLRPVVCIYSLIDLYNHKHINVLNVSEKITKFG